jgi:hypothetical protein
MGANQWAFSDFRFRQGNFSPVSEVNERATGIEPALPAWKAGTLPLSYARIGQ